MPQPPQDLTPPDMQEDQEGGPLMEMDTRMGMDDGSPGGIPLTMNEKTLNMLLMIDIPVEADLDNEGLKKLWILTSPAGRHVMLTNFSPEEFRELQLRTEMALMSAMADPAVAEVPFFQLEQALINHEILGRKSISGRGLREREALIGSVGIREFKNTTPTGKPKPTGLVGIVRGVLGV